MSKTHLRKIINYIKTKYVQKYQVVPEALMEIIQDCETPRNVKLSAQFKRSFAFPSMKDRIPVILTQVVDYLSRDKASIIECYGEKVTKEIKTAIGEISQFKNHVLTAKNFQHFGSSEPDTNLWNEHLERLQHCENKFNYFEADWIVAECYVYRRLREIFATKSMLKTLDPFSTKKTKLLENSLPAMKCLFIYFDENRIFDSEAVMPFCKLQQETILMLKIALWANKFDLSLKVSNQTVDNDFLDQITNLDSYLLVDDSHKAFTSLCSSDNSQKVVDIIVDNAGLEVVCDLCLADLFITRFHVKQVNFHVKPIPWFVSDVIPRDLHQTVMSVANYPDQRICTVGKRWRKYFDTGVWTVKAYPYWCLGKTYSEMCEEDAALYYELQKSSLIILKGDLNYRKLLQDINWDPVTPFGKALGKFHPAPLIALRTCKADLICGLKPCQAEKLSEKQPDWLISGEYGVIQYDANLN